MLQTAMSVTTAALPFGQYLWKYFSQGSKEPYDLVRWDILAYRSDVVLGDLEGAWDELHVKGPRNLPISNTDEYGGASAKKKTEDFFLLTETSTRRCAVNPARRAERLLRRVDKTNGRAIVGPWARASSPVRASWTVR